MSRMSELITDAMITNPDTIENRVSKDGIICRSGIQMYSKSDVINKMHVTPVLDKETYAVYKTPASIIRMKDKCKNLPATKEHPRNEWVTGENFNRLAGGVTDSVVEVVAIDDSDDVGLKTHVIFQTDSLYDYYEQGARDLSLGYRGVYKAIDNPEEKGYDVIMTEMKDANHVAVTRLGRGGKSVGILDSLFTMEVKSMLTGIKRAIAIKNGGTLDSEVTFGADAVEIIAKSKAKKESDVAKDMQPILDSLSELKDGDAKTHIVGLVKDCFEDRSMVADSKEAVVSILDSAYAVALKETDADMLVLDSVEKTDEKTDDVTDSTDGKGQNTNNIADSADEKAKKERDEKLKKEKDAGTTTDSLASIKDSMVTDITSALIAQMPAMIKKELSGKADETSIILDSDDSINDVKQDFTNMLDV